MESCDGLRSLHAPEVVSLHPESGEQIAGYVHSLLMEEPSPSLIIKFWTHEVDLGTNFLSLFESKFNFETWLHEGKIRRNLEVQLEHHAVGIKLEPEKWSPSWMPHVERFKLSVFV